ncbi:type IV pilin-like G/H family protein [Chamaesiphon sp. OTE_20_metabat_361]|uniref:type IV pilin protein n=1 Tax=Chamaesiphon sp. OTE_20_metabat_361 TaxID=2964689 RepID=UPI00286D2CB1|nr:type IV pilin-like G/H family protein [Chamaesiphon sp. OTE_20_metabat_361]
MRTELKAKFIQHLNARRNSEKGFTLVELLVVIVIIGILTAIALPAFLNETAKAKQTEGKQNVNSINKAQIARRAQEQTYTTDLDILAISSVRADAGTPATGTTTNYSYTISSDGTSDSARIVITSRDPGLKGFTGAVTRLQRSGQNIVGTVICEALSTGIAAPDNPGLAPNADPTCGANTRKLSI